MKQVEIKPPPGVDVPEGSKAGDEFKTLDTWRIKDNGECCLVEMDGVSMPGYEEGDDQAEHESYVNGQMAKTMQGMLGEAQNA